MNAARVVPMTNPIKIEMDFTNPFVKMLMSKIMATVMSDKVRLPAVGSGTLPPIFPIATGMSVKPIVVITEPVTMAGKNFASFEKMPEMRTTKIPDTMSAPNIAPLPWF